MLKTALAEGMTVRARRPARSTLGTDEAAAGDVGTVAAIGAVWDVSPEIHVAVELSRGRYVIHPVAFANNLWEPA